MRRDAPAPAALLLAVAFVALAPSASPGAEPEGTSERPRVGGLVSDFEIAPIQGEIVSLKAVLERHRAVVFIFLSTVCPYANYFAPHVRELDATYGPRGVLFVVVNSNGWETAGEVEEHARRVGFAFPVVKDVGHEIADRLDARATPEAFLIDGSRRLRYRGWVKSRQESPDLRRAIDAVLAGKAVRRPETKAFGCAVDRR